MAGSFAQLSAQLKLDISDFASKLNQASRDTKKFAANLRGKTVSEMEELNKKTNAWGLNLKSVSRVVSGILISQTFYRGMQSIQAATSAVWEFTKQLEYAHIAYSNLFGDTALAAEFINVLKDYAAETPFGFTEAESAAKRLLAYGIEYKNVMYVLNGVMSASAIQGDSTKIEAISRAFGQIYTYGKLMTQEVRQLSEAGIPAFEILQEELGLTQEQLRNLGNEGIPANEAINALVDGIEKRFGNVTLAAAKTTSGIISNIKDNATMLFAGIFEPLTTFIKSALVEVGDFLFAMREIFELKGIGGVFEAVFPEEMHGVLRQFVANLQAVHLAGIRLAYALSGLLKPILEALLRVYNAFAPIITVVTDALATLVYMVTSNTTAMKYLTAALAAAAAMWIVFKLKALATAVITTVIAGISKALAGLSAMLTFVLAHPFWALLIGLTGVLVGISGGFGAISDKVSGFFKQLTQFNGIDPDKILLPSQKERANDLDKFNKRLDGTSDAMDDLADSTGKATKAAKGLLSFDEAFKLNEPDEGTGDGIEVPDIDDLIGGLDGLGSSYMPEIPDFSEYTKLLTGNFLEKLKSAWESIKSNIAAIASTAIGSAFGGLVGALIGGKLGGIFGAIAGAIVGYFWNKLAEHFGLTPDQKVNAGIIGGVGALIGAVLGGIVGGPLGAKIGAIIGGFVGSFWGIFAEYLGVTPTQHIATLISGAISGLFSGAFSLAKSLIAGLVPTFIDDVFVGFSKTVGFSLKNALTGGLKMGVAGAIAGLVTGMLSNALTAWIADELNLTEQDLDNAGVGQIIGNIVGSIVGLVLGGPVGSIIGGSLGQLAGAVIGEFWAYLSTTLKGAIIGGAAGLPIGAIVGALVGSIGGPLGAALGALIGVALGGLIGLIVEKWDVIKEFFAGIGQAIADGIGWIGDGLVTIGTAIGDFFGSLGEKLSSAFGTIKDFFANIGSAIGDAFSSISSFFSNIFSSISSFIQDKFSGVITFFADIGNAISTVWNDISSAVSTVLNDLWDAISTVWNDISSAISTVLNDLWNAVITVWNDISSAISTVCEAVWGVISSIWNLIKDLVVKVFTDIWNALVEWFTPIVETIASVCSSIWQTISSVFISIFNKISQTLQNAWNAVKTFFTNIFNTIQQIMQKVWNVISSVFLNIFNTISQALQNIWSKITSVFTSIFNSISQALQNIWSKITEVFSSVLSFIRDTFTNIWNSIKNVFTNVYNFIVSTISNIWNNIKSVFESIYNTITNTISNAYNSVKDFFSGMWDSVTGSISGMYDSVKSGISSIYETFTGWISDLWDNVFGKFFDWIEDGIAKLREFFGLESDASSTYSDYSSSSSGSNLSGHATGGIFNREHVARFAEGNKAEAIIPLENASAMQPFVDAVANGITASLAPILANVSVSGGQQPMYVGTLIADDRSLKELERRMEVIRMQETRR